MVKCTFVTANKQACAERRGVTVLWLHQCTFANLISENEVYVGKTNLVRKLIAMLRTPIAIQMIRTKLSFTQTFCFAKLCKMCIMQING